MELEYLVNMHLYTVCQTQKFLSGWYMWSKLYNYEFCFALKNLGDKPCFAWIVAKIHVESSIIDLMFLSVFIFLFPKKYWKTVKLLFIISF